MKFVKIILKVIIMLIIFQMIYMPTVKAGIMDIILNAEDFLIQGKQENQGTEVIEGSDGTTIEKDKQIINEEELKKFNDQMFNILLSIGVILSVIIGAILGIQIMWGSIEQQTKAKEILLPYVISCCVIFGAFTIWKVVVNIGESVTETSITDTTDPSNPTSSYSTCPTCGHKTQIPTGVIIGGRDYQCPNCEYYGPWE